jgi:hypothetical protein
MNETTEPFDTRVGGTGGRDTIRSRAGTGHENFAGLVTVDVGEVTD